MIRRRTAVLVLASCLGLSACGNSQQLRTAGPDPSPTPSAGVIGRQTVSNDAWPAPLRDYLGPADTYSVIRASIDRIGDPFYGPARNADTAGAQTIYTPFELSSVQVLRGRDGPVDTVAVEGGAIGSDSVTVDGGALEASAGTAIYAVVTAPGTRQVGPAQAVVAHLFPVLANGDVFLRENILPDAASRNSPTDAQYTDRRGKSRQGRTMRRDAFESAVRNS